MKRDVTTEPSAQSTYFTVEHGRTHCLLRFNSLDGTNRMTQSFVEQLTAALRELAQSSVPMVITGNRTFFSAGADLNEIAALTGPTAFDFSKMGQALMIEIERFPAPVYAAISGYCMGGGLDLALACHSRIASPNSVFGHRGAALGLITGWGGTQRLPRLVGKGRALQMFVAAEKLNSEEALRIGLIDAIADDPVMEAVHRIKLRSESSPDTPPRIAPLRPAGIR
jgi:enoyl-CoA hydratase/carnithine racemase